MFLLKEARERARAARQLLADGVDPLNAKKADKTAKALAAAKTITFRRQPSDTSSTRKRNGPRNTRRNGSPPLKTTHIQLLAIG